MKSHKKATAWSLTAVLGVLVAFVYVRHYLAVAKSTTITQAHIQGITFDLLNNKNPLLVEDKVASCHEFVKTVFAYQYILARPPNPNQDMSHNMVRNRSKWLVIHSIDSDGINVRIAHPNQHAGKQAFVQVRLHHLQILVLPYRWWYALTGSAVTLILDDPFSLVVRQLTHTNV